MNLSIRAMAIPDKSAIMQILRNTPEFTPAEVVVAEEVIDSYLGNPAGSGYHVLLAELESLIVGYVSFGPTPMTEGTWDVYWIAVAQEHQGKRVGQQLLAAAENGITAARGRMVLIETSGKAGYEKTRRFYRSRGYQEICRIADFYAPGDDQVIFQKRPG